MSEQEQHSPDVVEEVAKPALKQPAMFKVILLNDDYTPMDFVVLILERFFNLSNEQAVQVMFRVHRDGKAVCGIFSRDVAETKVAQVNDFSSSNDYPLLCVMEAV